MKKVCFKLTALARFCSLPFREKLLLFETSVLLSLTYVGLLLLPSRIVVRIASIIAKPRNLQFSPDHESEVVWAVMLISEQLVKVSCLPQALTAQILLARRGISCELRIGIRKTPEGSFEGHAWIERGGQILIGGADSARFTSVDGLYRHRS